MYNEQQYNVANVSIYQAFENIKGYICYLVTFKNKIVDYCARVTYICNIELRNMRR